MKKRHIDGKPYTRTGDIVIAINPFQWFTHLYTESQRSLYSNRIVWSKGTGKDPRDELEPHVYECSSLAYKGLAFGKTDQSILVSGESGAGKTETVKIAMNHMASVQQGPKKGAAADVQDLDPVVKRVVESNPLLEAFGNASTRRNDNSSRFGKYLCLQFDQSGQNGLNDIPVDRTTCSLAGSKCDVYLLEKNRVTYHDEAERTYHIFYQILCAPDSEKGKYWDKLKGTNLKSFKYVGHTDRTKIEGQTDEEHYFHTVNTLAMVGVKDEKLKWLFQAILVVLQCGNLTFGPLAGDKDKAEITSRTEVTDLAGLMGVDTDTLTKAFTERTMKTRTETYKVPLKPETAQEAADSFAKEVYGKLFLWVVAQINAATCAEDNYQDGTMTDFGIVGLLDIFGFESFARNRFEQLCINYANEKLQQKFTEDVFQAVQAEYEAEGIELALITYDDNTDVLDLIEGRTGLLAMLNEECVRPKGNDKDFVNKALGANSKSECLLVNKYDKLSFGIHHYAGKVMYDADGFVAANQDTLPTDLIELGEKSTNVIISKPPLENVPDEPARKGPQRQKSNLTSPTIWVKYKIQLSSLMGNLRKTNSRYIRCIKPNTAKKPILMEHISTVEQLRCAGVVAAVTLARSAFPNNLSNKEARYRYRCLWDFKGHPSKSNSSMSAEEGLTEDCKAILESCLKNRVTKDKNGNTVQQYAVGRTKSYFKAGAIEYLEGLRSEALHDKIVKLQAYGRRMIAMQRVDDILHADKRSRKEEQERLERERLAAQEAAERAARDAAELAERSAREAREKAEAASKAREEERIKALKKYEDGIEAAKKAMEEGQKATAKRLEEIAARKKQLEAEIADLEEKTSDEARATLMGPKLLAAQQKKKVEENTKMIDFLKKENKKIRKEHAKVKSKWDELNDRNDKLLGANEASGDTFEDKEDGMRKVDNKNVSLMETLQQAKDLNKQLKEDCMKRQDEYMTQAETRLEYQKTMARILNMIQDQSKEAQIVEDTVCIALACESEAKSIMAALEAQTEDM
jgi:myosin V